jgi:hypothetical protein
MYGRLLNSSKDQKQNAIVNGLNRRFPNIQFRSVADGIRLVPSSVSNQFPQQHSCQMIFGQPVAESSLASTVVPHSPFPSVFESQTGDPRTTRIARKLFEFAGATSRDRTGDLLITKPGLSSLRRDFFSQFSRDSARATGGASMRAYSDGLVRFGASC